MSEENYPYAKEAKEQFEKVGKDWALGDLMQSAYGGSAPIKCDTWIQYSYQPTIDESKLTEEQNKAFKLPFVGHLFLRPNDHGLELILVVCRD